VRFVAAIEGDMIALLVDWIFDWDLVQIVARQVLNAAAVAP
jgi:hypothetical protein